MSLPNATVVAGADGKSFRVLLGEQEIGIAKAQFDADFHKNVINDAISIAFNQGYQEGLEQGLQDGYDYYAE